MKVSLKEPPYDILRTVLFITLMVFCVPSYAKVCIATLQKVKYGIHSIEMES
jgi:hypothetical protein